MTNPPEQGRPTPPPAPVITDAGSYGRLPPAPAADLSRFDGPVVSVRSRVTWLAGIAFVLVAALWLAALSARQITEPTVALPIQERAVASLTSIDELLATHAEEIASATPTATGGVAVPGLLVPGVELTLAEAQSGDPDLMRAGLLARSAAAIYAEGIAALQPPDGPLIETTTFSTPGGTRRVMELFGESNHDRASGLVQPLATVSLLLAAVVLLLGNGFSRFTALGLAMIGAAVLVVVGALLVKFGIAFIGSDGTALADELSQLVDAAAWAPIRNAIVFGGGGLALLVPAWLLHWFFDRSIVRPAPVVDTPPAASP